MPLRFSTLGLTLSCYSMMPPPPSHSQSLRHAWWRLRTGESTFNRNATSHGANLSDGQLASAVLGCLVCWFANRPNESWPRAKFAPTSRPSRCDHHDKHFFVPEKCWPMLTTHHQSHQRCVELTIRAQKNCGPSRHSMKSLRIIPYAPTSRQACPVMRCVTCAIRYPSWDYCSADLAPR